MAILPQWRNRLIIKSLLLNVLSDSLLIFIDVLILYTHQHVEQTAAPQMIYICVPRTSQL